MVINWPAGWSICLVGVWCDSMLLFDFYPLFVVSDCKVCLHLVVCLFSAVITISIFSHLFFICSVFSSIRCTHTPLRSLICSTSHSLHSYFCVQDLQYLASRSNIYCCNSSATYPSRQSIYVQSILPFTETHLDPRTLDEVGDHSFR